MKFKNADSISLTTWSISAYTNGGKIVLQLNIDVKVLYGTSFSLLVNCIQLMNIFLN